MKADTLLFCMKCSETQVDTSSLIHQHEFSVLFPMVRHLPTIVNQVVCNISDRCEIVPVTALWCNINSQLFAH